MNTSGELQSCDIEYINNNENVKAYVEYLINQNSILNLKLKESNELTENINIQLNNPQFRIEGSRTNSVSDITSIAEIAPSAHSKFDKSDLTTKASSSEGILKKYIEGIKKLKSAVLILKDRNAKSDETIKQNITTITKLRDELSFLRSEHIIKSKKLEEIEKLIAEVNGDVENPGDVMGAFQLILITNSLLNEENEKYSSKIKKLENQKIQIEIDTESERTTAKKLRDEITDNALIIGQLKTETDRQQKYIHDLEAKIQKDSKIQQDIAKAIRMAKQKAKSKLTDSSNNSTVSDKPPKSAHEIQCKLLSKAIKNYNQKLLTIFPPNYEKQIKMIVEYIPTTFSQHGKEFDAIRLLILSKRFYQKVKQFSTSYETVISTHFYGMAYTSIIQPENFAFLIDSCKLISILLFLSSRLRTFKKLIYNCDPSIFYSLANQYYFMIERENEFDSFCVKITENRKREYLGTDIIENIIKTVNNTLAIYFPENILQKSTKNMDHLDAALSCINAINLLFLTVENYIAIPHFSFMAAPMQSFNKDINRIKQSLVKICRGLENSDKFKVIFPHTVIEILMKLNQILSNYYQTFYEFLEIIIRSDSASSSCPELVNEDSIVFQDLLAKISDITLIIEPIDKISVEIHNGTYDNKDLVQESENSFCSKLHQFKTKMYSDIKAMEAMGEELKAKLEIIKNSKEELKKKDVKIYDMELTVSSKKREIDGLNQKICDITKKFDEDYSKINSELISIKKSEECLKINLLKNDPDYVNIKNAKIFNNLISFSKLSSSDFSGLRKLIFHERICLHNEIDNLHKQICCIKAEKLKKEINNLNFESLKLKTFSNSSKILSSSTEFISESNDYLNRLKEAINNTTDPTSLQCLLNIIKSEENLLKFKFQMLEKDYLNTYEHLPLKNVFRYSSTIN